MLENIIADVIIKFQSKGVTYAPVDIAREICQQIYKELEKDV